MANEVVALLGAIEDPNLRNQLAKSTLTREQAQAVALTHKLPQSVRQMIKEGGLDLRGDYLIVNKEVTNGSNNIQIVDPSVPRQIGITDFDNGKVPPEIVGGFLGAVGIGFAETADTVTNPFDVVYSNQSIASKFTAVLNAKLRVQAGNKQVVNLPVRTLQPASTLLPSLVGDADNLYELPVAEPISAGQPFSAMIEMNPSASALTTAGKKYWIQLIFKIQYFGQKTA